LVLALPGTICILGDLGVMKALIQIRDVPEKRLEHTALTLTVAINGIYFLVRFGCGIALAMIRHDSRIVGLGLLTGVNFFFLGVYSYQMAVLNRALRFRAESFQNVVFSLAQAATGIGLAWAWRNKPGWGVFALALQPMGAQIFANIAMLRHWHMEWPGQFDRRVARRILGFGGMVTFAEYLGSLGDIFMGLFVGGAFGASDLGLYAKAGQVKDLIGQNIVGAFARLLYPLMSASRDDADRLRQLFLRGAAGGVFLCWFGWAWFLATGWDLIPTVLGHQWIGARPLLMIASFDLLSAALMLVAMLLVQVIGEPTRWMKYQGAWLGLTILAAVGAWHWGLIAVAAAIYFAQGIVAVAFFRWAIGHLQIPVSVVARRLWGLLVAAIISYLVMWFLGVDVLHSVGPKLRLTVQSIAGGMVYLGVLYVTNYETIKEIRQMALGW